MLSSTIWIQASVVVMLSFLFFGCTKTPNQEPINSEAIEALGCVQSFLGCWQSRDVERGKIFLADNLRKTKSEEEWNAAICGVSNPHHAAYELGLRQMLAAGQYRFQVWLYKHYTGTDQEDIGRSDPGFIECRKIDGRYQITRVPEL